MRRTKIKEDLKGFRILRVRAMLCKRRKIGPFEHEAGHLYFKQLKERVRIYEWVLINRTYLFNFQLCTPPLRSFTVKLNDGHRVVVQPVE